MQLTNKDALIIVDVQKDFLEHGSLPVPGSAQIIGVLNRYIEIFSRKYLPVFATRDWHPLKHCSFVEQGGTWPEHCVQYTEGAAFAHGLNLPGEVIVISKGTAADVDAYSGFQGTDLNQRLQVLSIEQLFIGGLALDVCVLHTVLDAIRHGYRVHVLEDASRAVNSHRGDGAEAITVMQTAGASLLTIEQLA
ncbi:MAG: nicotinamidase [Gammaproteobacteria bacterium RIFCSPLOWO2_02_FULL_52_10]|nr:MAG: nicotinamidase [Gammaproteobacteria bacterium RIFCSPLOWO2_02_FULL_52_10]